MSNEKQRPKVGHEKEKGANTTYRKAIIKAIENLHDYHSRSNVDAIRRHTQVILSEQHVQWNDALFLQTLKSIVRKGEIDLFTKSTAELSPRFKRQRADSLLKKLEQGETAVPPPPIPPPPSHSHFSNESPKEAPKRRSEHEKWKIVPKKIYDHSTYVRTKPSVSRMLAFLIVIIAVVSGVHRITNPMDTH